MVRPAVDVTAGLWRHIEVVQLAMMMGPLSRQRWLMWAAAGGADSAVTLYRPSVHRGAGMVMAGWGMVRSHVSG
jgi:hypothetical protein